MRHLWGLLDINCTRRAGSSRTLRVVDSSAPPREIRTADLAYDFLEGTLRGEVRPQMNLLIESNPAIMMGKPVVRGTRITVEHILERLAAAETMEQLLEAHPRLTREAILAAIEFGAQALRADVIYPLPAA